MSLFKPSLRVIVAQLFAFRLKSHLGFFATLVVVHALSVTFSLFIGPTIGTTMGQDWITIRDLDNAVVLHFTRLWVFVVAFLLTTKPCRNADAPLVSNRLSSTLADIAFILTCSLLGGLLGASSAAFVRLVAVVVYAGALVVRDSFFLAPSELLMGSLLGSLSMALFGSLGYLSGALMRIRLGPVMLGFLLYFAVVSLIRQYDYWSDLLRAIVNLFPYANSLPFLAAKSLGFAAVVFAMAFIATKDLEVKE